MGGEEVDPGFALIIEATGLDNDQLENLKKGFEGFDKDGSNSISQTSMQMILKSMSIKDDMDNYAAEVDEEGSGKFSFFMFCQVAAKIMIEDDEGQMKEEVDEDGSGTLDFDEFQEMMMG